MEHIKDGRELDSCSNDIKNANHPLKKLQTDKQAAGCRPYAIWHCRGGNLPPVFRDLLYMQAWMGAQCAPLQLCYAKLVFTKFIEVRYQAHLFLLLTGFSCQMTASQFLFSVSGAK